MERIKWPGGAQCAVMLSFDFDAESLWISRDPANARRPGILSQGLYGAKVGVPEILEVVADYGLKTTFFVPGWVAEQHTRQVEEILKKGHEIGHHGYLHEWIDSEKPEEEERVLKLGLESLEKTVGVRPKGYRSPAGETSSKSFPLVDRERHRLRQLYDGSCQSLSTHFGGWSSGSSRVTVPLGVGRCSFSSMVRGPTAVDLSERRYPYDLAGRVSRNLSLGRVLRLVHASADHWPAITSRSASKNDKFYQ
jgi:peptidoglycan/xylan/chitin deacetylase (PgdA/CDA1 family)